MKFYWEKGKLDSRWINQYCKSNWLQCVRFEMEEKGIPHPDHMMPNGELMEGLT